MNITMEKRDPAYIRIEEICCRISDIVYEHLDLLDLVCLLLQHITKASNSITQEVEDFFSYAKCDVLENDLEVFDLLKNEFINYYELIQLVGIRRINVASFMNARFIHLILKKKIWSI